MKSLHNLINKTTRAAMQQDSQMKQVISRIVPANSMAHINFCRLEAGRLRITVDNATWIAKLRFSERQIVDALRQIKLDVVTLSFHVAPAETPVRYAAAPPVKRSSNAAAQALVRLADSTAHAEVAPTSADADHSSDSDRGENPQTHESTEGSLATDEQSVPPGRASAIRQPDDRLRQELLKLAAKLREET